MKDPHNPTADELRAWAYDDSSDSDQDWEYIVADIDRIALILEFAADKHCPQREFFLRCLYVLSWQDGHETAVKDAVMMAKNHRSEDVRQWSVRSLELFQPGGKFKEREKEWWKHI